MASMNKIFSNNDTNNFVIIVRVYVYSSINKQTEEHSICF